MLTNNAQVVQFCSAPMICFAHALDMQPSLRANQPSLKKERWRAIQKALRKGMSLRAIERGLEIHRATIKKFMDADGPMGGGPVLPSPGQHLTQCRYEGVTYMLNA